MTTRVAAYSWVLLDADGTLFDFRHAEAAALELTPAQMGISVPADYIATFHEINHFLWQSFEAGALTARDVRIRRFERVFQALDLPGDPYAFGEAYLQNLIKESTFLEGAERFLRCAREMAGLALLTNGFADVQHARIKRLGLDDVFEHVIISEEVGSSKPHHGVFDVAFERMGQPDKRTVLMLGDSLTSDIRGGSDYGIDTCWFNPQRCINPTDIEPTYEVRDLDDALDILRRQQNDHD